MAIQNTSFAKGEAVQKLIEVIARVNNKSVADDAALQVAINEVREMFKTDEMTEDTFENIIALQTTGGLEPGHMYKTEYNGATCIVIADSNSSFLQLGFVDGKAALINWTDMSVVMIEDLSKGDSVIPDSILHTMSYEQFCQMGEAKKPGHFYALTDAVGDTYAGILIIWNTTANFSNVSMHGFKFLACYQDRPCIYDAQTKSVVKYLDEPNTIYRDVDESFTLTSDLLVGDRLVLNILKTDITITQNIALLADKKGFVLELVSVEPSVKVTIAQRSASGSPISQYEHTINGRKTLTWTSNSWLWAQEQTSGTDDFIGSNTVTSATNIPVNKSTVVATLTANGAVSFASGLPEGREVYVIAQNSTSDPITLTFADANVESVTIANGERAEFSVINIAGTYYTRVGVDTAAADVEEISAEEVAAKFT